MLFALKSPLLLYPFSYFDPVRKRWVRARYVAERHVIESSYAQREIIGPPEIRTGSATMFNPWSKLPPRPAAHLHGCAKRYNDRNVAVTATKKSQAMIAFA